LFGYQSSDILGNFLEISSGQKPLFLGLKKPVFEAKTGVWGSKTGVSKHSKYMEYSELVLFRISSIPNFPKITKK